MSKKKKKNKKVINLLLLLGIVVILGGTYIWVSKYQEAKTAAEEEKEDTSEVLTSIDAEKAVKLEVKNENGTMLFAKEKDIWKNNDDKKAPIVQDKITSMLDTIAEVVSTQTIADNKNEIAEYSLDNPALTIKVTMEDKTTHEISLGIEAPTDSGGYYAIVDDKDGVYVVDSSIYTGFDYKVGELVEVEKIPSITSENITNYKVASKDEDILEIKTSGEQYKIVQPYDKNVIADDSQVSTTYGALVGVTFLQNIDYNCKDLKKYGLDKPAYTIDVNYNEVTTTETDENSEEEAKETKTPKTFQLLIGDKNEDGDYYATMSNSSAVQLLDESVVESLTGNQPYDFVAKEMITDEITSLKSLQVKAGNTTKTIDVVTKEVTGDDDSKTTTTSYKLNGTKIEDSVATDFYSKLSSLNIEGEMKKKVKDAKEILSVKLTRNSDSATTLKFYSYDDSYYSVKCGSGHYFLVDKRVVDDIVSAMGNLK